MTVSPLARFVRFLTLWMAVLLVAPALGVHASPLGGTLTGKIVMKTAGAALPSAPLPVTLLFYNPGYFRISDEAVDSLTTTTAPDGSFAFSGLDTSAAGVYRVVVRYKGIAYEPAERDFTDANGTMGKTRAVRFDNTATTATVEVPLYEPVAGAPQSGFTVTKHAIVINEVRPQFYSVVESLEIKNDTDHTFVESVGPNGEMQAGLPIFFSAPAAAHTVTTNRIDLLRTADLTGQKLTLRVPVVPGSSDVTCSYDLQGGAAGLDYMRTLDYATAQVQMLISDTKQAIISPNQSLAADTSPQAPQASLPFRSWTATNPVAGKQIELLISPSPVQPSAVATVAPKKSVLDRVRANFSAPALLTLAAICFLLMIVVLRMPTRPTSAKQVDTSPAAPIDDPAPAPAPARRATGRPADYDLDPAEREIEAANAEDTEDAAPPAPIPPPTPPRKRTRR